MSPQLLGTGILVAMTGVGFYLLALPIVIAWSIPLLIGGLFMAVVSLFVPPSSGPVSPPEGYKFCVYCSSEMPVGLERCERCNGLQPKA